MTQNEIYIAGGFVAVCIILFFIGSARKNAARRAAWRARLVVTYGDQIADRIMRGMFWQGQTKDQLVESLGAPLDIDQKVLKTKTREVWKYNQRGKNRYGLKITMEDGVVTEWDQK